MHNGKTRRRRKRDKNRSNNDLEFPKLMSDSKTTDPDCSENTNQDKCKKSKNKIKTKNPIRRHSIFPTIRKQDKNKPGGCQRENPYVERSKGKNSI